MSAAAGKLGVVKQYFTSVRKEKAKWMCLLKKDESYRLICCLLHWLEDFADKRTYRHPDWLQTHFITL